MMRFTVPTTWFLLAGFLALALGCSPTPSPPANKAHWFFDLTGFLEEQDRAASGQSPVGQKTVTLDGQTETHPLTVEGLDTDLAIFRTADINRPAWTDKYRREVSGQDTTYIALDSSLYTRQLSVLRNAAGQVKRLEIYRRTGNVLSSGSQRLVFEPGEGYQIVSKQRGRLVGTAAVKVEVAFTH